MGAALSAIPGFCAKAELSISALCIGWTGQFMRFCRNWPFLGFESASTARSTVLFYSSKFGDEMAQLDHELDQLRYQLGKFDEKPAVKR